VTVPASVSSQPVVLVCATDELVRRAMPHNSWMPEFAAFCEGRCLGRVVRETGGDLLLVRFSLASASGNVDGTGGSTAAAAAATASSSPLGLNASLTVSGSLDVTRAGSGGGSGGGRIATRRLLTIGCTLPRSLVVPAYWPRVQSSPALSAGSAPPLSPSSVPPLMPRAAIAAPPGGAMMTPSPAASAATFPALPDALASAAATLVAARRADACVTLRMPDDAAKPLLCVVCGSWSAPGQHRSSGFKCCGCIGTPSKPPLQATYRTLVARFTARAPPPAM
jgi:hypothetical protein